MASPARTLAATFAIAVGLLIVPAAGLGAAETGKFQMSDAYSFPEDDSGTCLGPTAIGILTATEDIVGHFTANGPPTFGFHARMTSTADVRIDYQDGRYIVATIVDHFGFNATAGGTQNETHAMQADGTLYDPDGQPLGPVTARSNTHFTFRDVNANGQPDPGEIAVNFNHFHLFCH